MTRTLRSWPARGAALVAAAVLALGGCSAATGAGDPGGGNGGANGGQTVPGCPTSQPAPLPGGETRTVTIATKDGQIAIRVEGALSPIAAGNFVALAACHYYDRVVVHRVAPGFVIQAGDGRYGRAPNIDRAHLGGGGPGYTIADEPVTSTYARGVVAMARSTRPNSQGSQFFIVLDDAAADSLAAANTYAIFGHVTSGMDVVDRIAAEADAEIPSDPVVMQSVTVSNP